MKTDVRFPCPDCCGEGTIESEVPRGKYNKSGGYWEPHYIEVPCDTCKGEGWVYTDDDWEIDKEAGLVPKVTAQANITLKVPPEPDRTALHMRELAALRRLISDLEAENALLEKRLQKLKAAG